MTLVIQLLKSCSLGFSVALVIVQLYIDEINVLCFVVYYPHFVSIKALFT